MRVSKREKLTFVALWALGALLVAQVMGCSPSLQTNTGEETTQEEGEKRIGAEPAYGEQPNANTGTLTDTSVVTDSGATDTVPEVLTLGFLETDCGHSVNDSACDFRLLDQNDNPWKLSDYAGDVVLLDLTAMYCAPCQAAAATAQATHDDYASKGFHYVTILVVDAQNDTVQLSEAQHWANTFGITSAPVLQGSRDLLVSGGASHGYPLTSWPTFVFIDRSQTVAYGLRGFNEAWIRNVVEGLL